MRIAALDDDALQLDLIKQATEAMGHVCHTHLNGASFQREMRRETFDLLIVDWHLPDTTGPEIVRWVRKNMGRLLSRDHLKDIVWGQVADVMSRSLDTHISRLRTLLDLRPANGFIVSAVYGVGYRFEAVEAQRRA